MNDDLSAPEAARILGISVATLYSYVSRGLLTPIVLAASRSKRYPREAVMRLAARMHDAKRGGHSAAAAMHWGVPVLETSISCIEGGRLRYRGVEATALADHMTLEAAACLLWDDQQTDYFAGAAPILPTGWQDQAAAFSHRMPLLPRAAALLTLLAHSLPPPDAGGILQDGPRLMRCLAAILLGTAASDLPLHQQLGMALGADGAQTELIRAAMVLLADHELNASTFTVRCVASTGASLPEVMSAGLLALSGEKHGGGSAQARRMLAAALASPAPVDAMVRLVESYDPSLCGYGHPLYEHGDPRAAYLFERLRHTMPATSGLAQILAVCAQAGSRLALHPNADMALASMEMAYGWPEATSIRLFALARAAGWIAHAAEQTAMQTLIRPRSRYVGRYRRSQ